MNVHYLNKFYVLLLHGANFNSQKSPRNMDKPLLRRKSDLPADSGTVHALFEHKRPDEYLKTPPPDGNAC